MREEGGCMGGMVRVHMCVRACKEHDGIFGVCFVLCLCALCGGGQI